eukprot:TRINITY_DN2264_c0_g1_i1.p1 TRINITY_DN2264_c0_g1~~TRINITY_DN2264_c0_g1_i1.p1  ORF type:complete len:201 (-),score=44.62 TRINITY_DN2264_c0_g1_i1:11-613(-)
MNEQTLRIQIFEQENAKDKKRLEDLQASKHQLTKQVQDLFQKLTASQSQSESANPNPNPNPDLKMDSTAHPFFFSDDFSKSNSIPIPSFENNSFGSTAHGFFTEDFSKIPFNVKESFTGSSPGVLSQSKDTGNFFFDDFGQTPVHLSLDSSSKNQLEKGHAFANSSSKFPISFDFQTKNEIPNLQKNDQLFPPLTMRLKP